MKKIKLISYILFICIIFSGCITKELPAFKTYSLIDNTKISKNINKKEKTIQVYEPKAIASINSKNILYSKQNLQQEAYALSKWSDRPTKMIQKLIVSSLNKTQNYKYVTSSKIKIQSDLKILSEIIELKHEFKNKQSYAIFSIDIYLNERKSNKVYFKNFYYKSPLDKNKAQEFVKVSNQQINSFLKELNLFIKYPTREN